MSSQAFKIDGKIKNPCYNEKTKTDCEKRAVGCHAKCNRYKIYKTLKKIEQEHKNENVRIANVVFGEQKSKSRRLKKIQGKAGWDK